MTGEGRLDAQTAMGKTPLAVAEKSASRGVPVIALGGCVAADAGALNDCGICAFFPIVAEPCSIDAAMNRDSAYANLRRTSEQVFRLAGLRG